jgi:hypothetical protein
VDDDGLEKLNFHGGAVTPAVLLGFVGLVLGEVVCGWKLMPISGGGGSSAIVSRRLLAGIGDVVAEEGGLGTEIVRAEWPLVVAAMARLWRWWRMLRVRWAIGGDMGSDWAGAASSGWATGCCRPALAGADEGGWAR